MLFSSYPKLVGNKYVLFQCCSHTVCLRTTFKRHFVGFSEAKAFNIGDKVMAGRGIREEDHFGEIRPNWNGCLHILPSVNQAVSPSSSRPGVKFSWKLLSSLSAACKSVKSLSFPESGGGGDQWVTSRAEVKGALRVHRVLTLHNRGSAKGLWLNLAMTSRQDNPVIFHQSNGFIPKLSDVADSWLVAGRWSRSRMTVWSLTFLTFAERKAVFRRTPEAVSLGKMRNITQMIPNPARLAAIFVWLLTSQPLVGHFKQPSALPVNSRSKNHPHILFYITHIYCNWTNIRMWHQMFAFPGFVLSDCFVGELLLLHWG